MELQAKPLVSIGIIFKNNIRSIERCLKALQPLRDAFPCELVIADTGSDDGSRAVAEKYADVLFDFPWINDFAAARNAVIDRCTGEWFLSVDTDEYLDEDIAELCGFLEKNDPSIHLCRVNIRNYQSYDMAGAYADFFTVRLVRMSTGARYRGAIHESWVGIDVFGDAYQLTKTIFHHDGYVGMEKNTEKLQRNMTLLRKKLRSEPKNLLVRLQILESGLQEDDYVEQVRKAVILVKRKAEDWRDYGPPIVRHAVVVAKTRGLPEFEKWADLAEEWFPDSYYTRIDVAAQRALDAFEKGNTAECVRRCALLQEAYADYRAGRGDMDCQLYSTLQLASPNFEHLFRLMAAVACLSEDMLEEARDYLTGLEYSQLGAAQMENLVNALFVLRNKSSYDMDELVLSVWESITEPKPSKKHAEERRLNFLLHGSTSFLSNTRRTEAEKGQRHAYTIFVPLVKECGLGTAAAVMESKDPAEIEALLDTVEALNELPFPAISHAIKAGVPFPLPSRPLDIEGMEGMAKRLAGDWDELFSLVELAMERGFTANWRNVVWTRAMVLAAVQGFGWQDEQKGMTLAKAFVQVEREYNSFCYAPGFLREENIFALPAIHRFGWYCVQAFDALNNGDRAGYVRRLREGLSSYPSMKSMVKILLDNTPELQPPKPSEEMLSLANQVRTLLSMYPADHPAVEAVKASEAYQKVAYLIEGIPAPVFGGLPQ